MEKILSLDITANPMQAIVITHDKDSKIIDTCKVPVDIESLYSRFDRVDVDEHSQEDEYVSQAVMQDQNYSEIEDFIKKHEADVVSSVLVISSKQFISLNLDMPFGKQKLVDEVLDNEIRDLLPFETETFSVSANIIDQQSDNLYDVHVGLLSKNYIDNLIKFCRNFGFDPEFITTASSALSGVKNSLIEVDKDRLVVLRANGKLYVNSFINNKFRNDQIFDYENDNFPVDKIKMYLLSLEDRYNTTITQLSIIGGGIDSSAVENKLKLSVTKEALDKHNIDSSQFISLLAALSVSGSPDENLLNNFRVKEFVYRPYIKVSKDILKQLWKYMLLGLFFLCIIPLSIYGIRAYKISKYKSEISNQVSSHLPAEAISSSGGIGDLLNLSVSIEDQLDSLGTTTKATPLEVLTILSDELKEAVDPKIKMDLFEIDIKGNKVELEGSVPSYRGVDKIESILKDIKNRDIFCFIKAETSGGRGPNKKFKFKIKLC